MPIKQITNRSDIIVTSTLSFNIIPKKLSLEEEKADDNELFLSEKSNH